MCLKREFLLLSFCVILCVPNLYIPKFNPNPQREIRAKFYLFHIKNNPMGKSCITCKKPVVLREDPVGIPPIVAPPFPLTAYGIASVDEANHVLYVGGLQGFNPDGTLPDTVKARVENAYAQAFAVQRFYG